MNRVAAAAFASGAVDALAQLRQGGRVWACYRRTLVLEASAGRLLALHGADVPPSPFSLVLETLPTQPWPPPGTAARRSDGALDIGALRVGLDGIRGLEIPGAPRRRGVPALAEARAALQPLAARSAFGRWWLDDRALGEALAHRGRAAARTLVKATAGRRPLLDAALPLMGLGPGSTPAGDDFLLGFVAAWLWLGEHPSRARVLAKQLAAAAPHRTSRLAAEFYYHLQRGRLSESLARLLVALAEPGPAAISACAHSLAAAGATSGYDTLAGIHAWLLARPTDPALDERPAGVTSFSDAARAMLPQTRMPAPVAPRPREAVT